MTYERAGVWIEFLESRRPLTAFPFPHPMLFDRAKRLLNEAGDLLTESEREFCVSVIQGDFE